MVNAESHPRVAALLTDMGYPPETIEEGKQMLEEGNKVYAEHLYHKAEKGAAYKVFLSNKKALVEAFKLDKEKAKAVFRKDEEAILKLGIDAPTPRIYVKMMDAAKTFYSVLEKEPALLEKLKPLQMTAEDVSRNLELIRKIEKDRGIFMQQKAEAQDATQVKTDYFVKLDDWMTGFYTVAKIAFKDNPQLLETFGKVVRA
jgi:hypothetical protein